MSAGPAAIYERTAGGWDRVAEPAPRADRTGFGRAVAVGSGVAVVGAPNEGGPPERATGAAYVYERAAGWTETARLEVGPYIRFGTAAAVGPDELFVRAQGAELGGDAVFVFVRRSGRWAPADTLTSPDGAIALGVSLAVDGDVHVVGAARGARGAEVGTTFVYRRSAAGWSLEAELPNPAFTGSGSPFGDGGGFGTSVDVDGDRIVVGAPSTEVGGVRAVGAAFVFERAGGTWALVARLDNPEPSLRDFFAQHVGIDNETVVVGSEAEGDGAGAVFTFDRSGGSWSLVDRLSEDGAFSFGTSLAVDGGVLLVGAPYGRSGDGTGAAYVYQRAGDGWAAD